MSVDNTSGMTQTQPDSTMGRLATGFALVGSGAVWFLHLCVMYFLVQPICRVGGEGWFHVVTVVALLGCVAAAVISWRHREQGISLGAVLDGKGSWRSFVALFGITAAAIFAYAILYQWIPVLTTATCEGMRPLQ